MQQTPKEMQATESKNNSEQRWQSASDTKGQNFETSNNNAIYVCDAIAVVLFPLLLLQCTTCIYIGHKKSSMKLISLVLGRVVLVLNSETRLTCASSAADGLIINKFAHFAAKDPRNYILLSHAIALCVFRT